MLDMTGLRVVNNVFNSVRSARHVWLRRSHAPHRLQAELFLTFSFSAFLRNRNSENFGQGKNDPHSAIAVMQFTLMLT